MKKWIAVLLAIVLLAVLCPAASLAAEPDISQFELPKPEAPVYLMFDGADRTATEGSDALSAIAVLDLSVAELGAEYEADSDGFYEKYGLYSFVLYMQFDTSLDGGEHWNYTAQWDTDYNAPNPNEATAVVSVRSSMFEAVSIFDLCKKASYLDSYEKIADATIQRIVPDGEYSFNNFYFDYENHSLSIRCRYYMSWETYDGENIGQRQSKVGEWSEIAIFGKDGNAVIPEEPTGYEAPVISKLQYIPPTGESELGSLTYIQATPEQTWMAGIYYEMTGNGNFDGLETQISIDGGAWQSYETVDAWGDWCLWNGERTAYNEEPRIEADSDIKLRVRYTGTHGPSEWSNIAELNGGGTQEIPEETADKPAGESTEDQCSLCGFCPVPLGLCILIWLCIILVLMVLGILVIKPKKCKKCGEKLKKGQCPKCKAD